MNILIITDKLIFGGAEMYFCKLENQLQHPDITFHYAAGSGELYEKLKHKYNFSEMSRTKHYQNIKKLRDLITFKQIDVIHANSLRMVLYCIITQKLTKRKFKIVYTKHNVTVLEEKSPFIFAHLLNKYVARIITVSEFEKRNLVKAGIDPTKITTVYNGVDLNQFVFHRKVQGESFNVGILARLSEEKNHELFINIAKQLRNNPNIMFYIAGDGPEKENIKNMIKSHSLHHKIKMVGAVHKPEEFIKEMDLLVLTSYREVFPMVVLEAMAVGTPIISIDRGGVGEAIIGNKTGFLINDHSTEDFCNKILAIESDREIREHIIENARRKVQTEFSLEQMVSNTLKEYLNCS
ncbi:glycosyltransferase family 1 protein [Bacillus salipaludis]|uniref:Glycosyltransferase family 1 protein n=1 Tax=Bacillus salipaludis TaxID=2547811 RepID=A0A4R5VUT5_9BACI|nr:glycosyltransferase family 4 protein [Bacillus salipaludis]MDQ6600121.1 glycosyltransferase family 4 protein [Bacillus salipaludis]TDK62413.1 glycosyltransferase family 1 protein [Bacillus salipaludis]